MKFFISFLLLTVSCSAVSEVIQAPMESDRWSRNPTSIKYEGRDAFVLSGGGYLLKDVEMTNGRIMVDIFTPGQRGFLGMVFRQQDLDSELFYFRPHKSRLPDTVQYTPVFNGMSGWQLYHDERYLQTAEIPNDRWVTYEVEFQEKHLKISIDGKTVLETQLKQPVSSGGIGIWGNTAGIFSNFRYELFSDQTPNKAPTNKTQTIDEGVITDWQLSQRFSVDDQSPNKLPSNLEFRDVTVEDQGFVNISRYLARGKPKALAYGKTVLSSDKAKRIKLWFGYSDEITIFLNGQPQFEANSSYNFRAPFGLGLLDSDHDAIYLDLAPGDNELIFAVSETFGGWGFMAKTQASEH